MSRQRQIDLLKRLLHCVDTKTTALADAPWRNDVSVYADPQHLSSTSSFAKACMRAESPSA